MLVDALQTVMGALIATSMLVANAFACYAINAQWLRSERVWLRFACLGLSALVLQSALFHVLLALHCFRSVPSLAAWLACAAALSFGLRYSWSAFVVDLRADVRSVRLLLRVFARSRWCAVNLVFALMPIVLSARVALGPPLGWDALTTYAVKAALFVQRGGPLALDLPGGFGLTRYYPAGAEIFRAWGMLPFHGDLVAGFVDLWHWCLLGVVTYALAAELGVRAQYRLAGVLYLLALPATWRLVGAGGQELSANCALLGGVTAAMHFMRGGATRFLSFGVMLLALCCGIKLALLPAAGLCAAVLLCDAVFRWRQRLYAFRAFAIGMLLGALLLAPFMIENWRNTGYPLAYVAAKLFGWQLGVANPTMLWYQEHAELRGFSFAREWFALTEVFAPAWEPGLHISRVSLLPIALATVLFAFGMARQPRVTMLLAAVAAGTLAFYYQTGFKVVRLIWGSTGRFLLPLVAVTTVTSLVWCRRSSLPSRAYQLVLCASAAVHVAFNFNCGFSRLEWYVLAILTALLLTSIALRPLCRDQAVSPAALFYAFGGVVLLCLTLEGARSYTRNDAIVAPRTADFVPRYWARAAARADDLGARHVIAVTAGPEQNADNWFLYHFLGRKLQNRLTHVPLTTSGRIDSFSPHDDRGAEIDVERWYGRLRSAGVTLVMSFSPPSLELSFMQQRPDLFERLEGQKGWGLFRLRTVASVRGDRARTRLRPSSTRSDTRSLHLHPRLP
jgi:hypothetical protein